jgi:GTP-binding protein
MKFIDNANIFIKAGKGGDGHISFRTEKYVPKGGPDGGNGGNGGSVIFVADSHLTTLLDFRYHKNYIAKDGQQGGKNKCSGKNGDDLILKVPVGTMIIDTDTKEEIADLSKDKMSVIVAKGGNGGFGNAMFATPTNQSPRNANQGLEGGDKNLTLELKLIANVGLVGLPNVGKSTLISVISSAKPKIADYPFTTLVPNIGIVKIEDYKSFAVADIPGLIEKASEGKGLGIQFLRHIERTQVLVFLIDSMSESPIDDYKLLKNELKKYNPIMLQKKKIICLSRIDGLTNEQLKAIKKIKFKEPDTPIFYISSVMSVGVEELKYKMWELVTAYNEKLENTETSSV